MTARPAAPAPDPARTPALQPDRLALARMLRGTGRQLESTVRGGSMRGSLPAGTPIRIRCDAADDLAIGQVVAFVLEDRLVAHRLVARGGGRRARFLVTLGDGTMVCDAPVADDVVLGVVVAFESGGEWLPVPAAPVRRGWRRAGAALLLGVVRAALRLDPRVASSLVDVAQFARRIYAAARGTPGQRLQLDTRDATAHEPER